MSRLAILSAMLLCVAARAASAQDEVYERGKDKPHKSFVAKESAKGILLKDNTFIPAEKIDEVVYEVKEIAVRLKARQALAAEKDALDPGKSGKRAGNLADALKKYQETLATVAEAPAKRHTEYKIAVILARQAADDAAGADAAMDALKKYKSKHPDSWQVGKALQLLGRLQLDAKDYEGARETYSELSEANVPADVKQDAQLQVVHVLMRADKRAEAEKLLDDMVKALPAGSKHALRAKIVQAELMVAAKKGDEAIKLLRQITKETSDRDLKAAAYNTLGLSLFERQDYKAALWEFLWVDVIYNQDKNEHAKALYYLWRTFDELGDAPKAQEFREALLGDRAFATSEWRARAQKESKSP